MIKLLLFTVLFSFSLEVCWGQDANHFSGTLTYRIERVDVKDSVQAKMIIFARDSLIKIVNFSSDFGKQETIKHLIYQKKYVLIELDQEKFAVQIKDSPDDTTAKTYTFHPTKGHSKIAGLKGKKLAAKYTLITPRNEPKCTLTTPRKRLIKRANKKTKRPCWSFLLLTVGEHSL